MVSSILFFIAIHTEVTCSAALAYERRSASTAADTGPSMQTHDYGKKDEANEWLRDPVTVRGLLDRCDNCAKQGQPRDNRIERSQHTIICAEGGDDSHGKETVRYQRVDLCDQHYGSPKGSGGYVHVRRLGLGLLSVVGSHGFEEMAVRAEL